MYNIYKYIHIDIYIFSKHIYAHTQPVLAVVDDAFARSAAVYLAGTHSKMLKSPLTHLEHIRNTLGTH
jgi:hypothetical protein